MATKQHGLGRGLGELFVRTEPEVEPEGAAADAETSASLGDGSYLAEIEISSIHANPKQPRQVFDEEELAELAQSIAEVGVLQPVVVRAQKGDQYELVMGERRLRAAGQAGLTRIPAIVRATEDGDLLRDALLENLHRVQLNPLEEAAAYQQLLAEFDCTQDELSRRIKRSRSHIANTIRLLRLTPPVQRRVAAGVLSAGHARALLALDDPHRQEWLAGRIVSEGLSVRSVEEIVALGESDASAPATPRARRPRAASPREAHVEGELSDWLDTRVKVTIGRQRGRIVIEFADGDDLDRIVGLINKPTN